MQIALIATSEQANTFLNKINIIASTVFVTDSIDKIKASAEVIFDFLFDGKMERIQQLNQSTGAVFVNSVSYTLNDTSEKFIRFNGWNTFIDRNIWEISVTKNSIESYKQILKDLKIDYIEVPNNIGLVAPRVVSMLVNEAYYAIEDEISTKDEIDTAMKLGTNYPFGPFEWSSKIGLHHIYQLLHLLSEQDQRYTISKSLLEDFKLNSL